jgi:hypothetical protein
MIRPTLTALLVAFVAYGVTARASPQCMTFGEARAAFPGKHLFWHGRAKCWDDHGRPTAHLRAPLPGPRPDKTPMLLFPTLVEGTGTSPDMLNAGPSSEWPLILDVDSATADAPDQCCWPPLDEPPAATFTERWLAMPPAWVLASKTP